MEISTFKGKNPIITPGPSMGEKQSDHQVNLMFETLGMSRGAMLARKGKLSEAESIIAPLTGDACRNAAILDLMAKIHIRQGKPDEARKLWERAVMMEPSNSNYSAALKKCLQIISSGNAYQPVTHIVKIILQSAIIIAVLAGIAVAGFFGGRLAVNIGNQINSIDEKVDKNIANTAILEETLRESQLKLEQAIEESQTNMEQVTPPPVEEVKDLASGVQQKINSDSSLRQYSIIVSQTDEIVSIEGAVPTNYLRNQVELLARSVPDVQYVDLKDLVVTGEYKIKKGDTLWFISSDVYGDPKFWPIISEANNISDSGQIAEGQILIIPTF